MTGVSSLAQALGQIERLKDQTNLLTTLSVQLTTGKKAQKFSGLDTSVLVSKRARADFKSLETYVNNIDHADRRIKLMLNAVEEFKKQAESFSNALIGFSQQGPHTKGDIIEYNDPASAGGATQVGVTSASPDVDFSTLQDLAKNLFPFMVDLLNAQETDRYLLGGSDTLKKPLEDNGTLDAAVSSLIANWKNELSPSNISSSQLISALTSRTNAQSPHAITDSIIGYSPALSAGNVGDIFIRVNETSEIKYTALANDQAFRDVLVTLSYFKNENLGPIADVFAEPYTPGDPVLTEGAPGANLKEMQDNFYEVFNAMSKTINQAIDEIDKVRFNLESARARISEIRTNHKQQQNVLLDAIAGAEDVDINEVAVKITSLQTQLEASYRVTAIVQTLSLTRFLG